jgi:hypothetical protein
MLRSMCVFGFVSKRIEFDGIEFEKIDFGLKMS